MEATMWCFEKIENGRNVEKKERFQNLKLFRIGIYRKYNKGKNQYKAGPTEEHT